MEVGVLNDSGLPILSISPRNRALEIINVGLSIEGIDFLTRHFKSMAKFESQNKESLAGRFVLIFVTTLALYKLDKGNKMLIDMEKV